MRRPIVFLFLSFSFGIAVQYNMKPELFVLVLSAGIIAGLSIFTKYIKWHQSHTKLVCLFLLVFLLGCAYFYLAENKHDPLESSIGNSCLVQGRIVTVQIKETDSYQMLITAPNFGKRLIQVKGIMENRGEVIGKWVALSGTAALPSKRRNPNLFDYRLYLKTKGVRVIIMTDSGHITVNEEKTAIIPSMLARLKYGFLDQLEKVMHRETFGIMAGMLFGDRSFISEETYEAFQKNGIAHILSVSGIHVGIIYLYVNRLLGNKKTRFFYILSAVFLIFYAALSEFSPSVVRAVVMIFIHMLSKVSYRRYDFLSCTVACATGMLLFNPYYLFNTGFQLSYMAVFCLAVMLPWVNRKIDNLEGNGVRTLWVKGLRFASPLLVIQIGMAPLTAYQFNYFSMVSFLINIPIIAVSSMIIPLGISLIPLSFLGGVFFGVGAQAAELLIDMMIWLNEKLYLSGSGFINVASPSIFVMLLFYGFFFFISSEFLRILKQRRHNKEIVGICFVIILVAAFTSIFTDSGYQKADLVFVDVGQGDCLHIHTSGGKNILIDSGGNQNYDVGKKILLPYLLKRGVTSIDLAIVTHLHDDHYLGLTQLAQSMEIKQLGTYEANQLREQDILLDTNLEKQDLLYLTSGDRIQIEKDVWIDVLYPEEHLEKEYKELISEETDENKSSLLLKVYDQGLTVLMTGDIGLEGEEEILNQYRKDPNALDVDILKIGHHGSRYSTGDDFLNTVSPEVAVFQVGKNNYGHPHPTIIEKCSEKGIMIYRNDLNGAIIFKEEGKRWHIKVLL